MSLQVKMRYFSSLALSALHFHAAGWLPFSQSEWNALHKGHNKHLKRVTLMHFRTLFYDLECYEGSI